LTPLTHHAIFARPGQLQPADARRSLWLNQGTVRL
jgi:hypothetical protein